MSPWALNRSMVTPLSPCRYPRAASDFHDTAHAVLHQRGFDVLHDRQPDRAASVRGSPIDIRHEKDRRRQGDQGETQRQPLERVSHEASHLGARRARCQTSAARGRGLTYIAAISEGASRRNARGRTACVPAGALWWTTKFRIGSGSRILVSLTFASWNLIRGFLRQIEGLRLTAPELTAACIHSNVRLKTNAIPTTIVSDHHRNRADTLGRPR